MSESTSAPAEGASAPAPEAAPPSAPAPASQPALSVTEAARLLGKRRHGADVGEGGQETATKRPEGARSGQEMARPAERGLSAMERALGVPEGGASATPAAPVADDGVEFQGERFTPTQLRDLIDRGRDYTRKTQALAEQQRQLEAQRDSLATVLPYIQPELARLQEMVQGVAKPDPALLRSDPQRYFEQREAYERAVDEQGRLASLTTLQQQAQARAMEQQVNQAHEQLAKEFSFWADPAERSAAQQEIVNWALNKGGFQRDELRGLSDARALKVMMKAMQFDKWVSGARTSAPPSQLAAPVRGAPPPPAPTERIATATQAFEERPTIRSGAALLTARRANGQAPR